MLTSKELKNEQLAYAAALGGFLELSESDATHNGYNRSILTAYKKEHENVYLGRFNYYDEERHKILNDELSSVYEEYNGGYVYNFKCDYCVPIKDELLDQHIRSWNKTADTTYLDKAHERIELLGGFIFIWT